MTTDDRPHGEALPETAVPPALPPRLIDLAGTPAHDALLRLLAAGTRLRRVQVGDYRVYVVEGHDGQLVSVSTALGVINKPGLVGWARRTALEAVRSLLLEGADAEPYLSRDPETVEALIAQAHAISVARRDEAARFGSELHHLIEEHILGREPEPPPELVDAYAAYLDWERQADAILVLAELPVYSLQHGYAGTVDAIGIRRDGQGLLAFDWKTSGKVYPEHALQVAAYAQALEELTGLPVEEGWIVRLAKDRPAFEARRVADWRRAFPGFLAALDLWHHMRTDHLGEWA